MKKQKKEIRWDKVIGFITIITMIVFAFIIYQDFKPRSSSTQGGIKDSSEVQEQAVTKDKNEKAESKTVVCIDAGHGGSDSGGEGLGVAVYEKTQTLAVSLKVQAYLEAQGIEVVMTRTTDKYLSLEERVQIANNSDAVAIVSIHRNYYEGIENVYGAEAWIHSSEPHDSKMLANSILSRLYTDVDEDNRGVKMGSMDGEGDYYINSNSKCASCILELGFITSKADDALVTTKIDATAKAIGDGIINYLKTMGYING